MKKQRTFTVKREAERVELYAAQITPRFGRKRIAVVTSQEVEN